MLLLGIVAGIYRSTLPLSPRRLYVGATGLFTAFAVILLVQVLCLLEGPGAAEAFRVV